MLSCHLDIFFNLTRKTYFNSKCKWTVTYIDNTDDSFSHTLSEFRRIFFIRWNQWQTIHRARPDDTWGKSRRRPFAFSVAEKNNGVEKHPRKNWPKILSGMLVEGIWLRVTGRALWELLGRESAVASSYSSGPTKCHWKTSPSPPPLHWKGLALIF